MPPPPAAPPQPRPSAAPARPPQREPVRLRYWLIALGFLWLVWIMQKPSPKKIEARIDKAIAMAQACKGADAQAELIALGATSATAEQKARLQAALNAAAASCERKQNRARPRASTRVQQAQSARNLIAEAEADIARGDYRAASDKMEVCGAMVDDGRRDCAAVKVRADRLRDELARCLASGGDWAGQRCER
ncbi:MAG: hypothetical protein ABIT83_25930 [Massilia sp.]